MKHIPLAMIRDHMDHIPVVPCPAGYAIRTFATGDGPRWAQIETLAGEFPDQDQALRRFDEDFGLSLSEMEERGFILENESGDAIGTATAWYGHFAGEERGRVSWVGIVPAYQGRKLSRPLLSAVMTRLARDHRTAYLTTQTTSYRAVNLYLSYGFVPYLTDESSREGWLLMEQVLQRRILSPSMPAPYPGSEKGRRLASDDRGGASWERGRPARPSACGRRGSPSPQGTPPVCPAAPLLPDGPRASDRGRDGRDARAPSRDLLQAVAPYPRPLP